MTQHFERLIGWIQSDPMVVNSQTSREDGEVQINAGEGGQAQCHAEEMKPLHDFQYPSREQVAQASSCRDRSELDWRSRTPKRSRQLDAHSGASPVGLRPCAWPLPL